MTFVIRKFDHAESLGEKLKLIRATAGLTLSELAAKTKIRKRFLQAFEAGAYNKLPDLLYARNYLKIYVRALGGDVEYFLEQFEAECGTCDFTKGARLPRKRLHALQFLVASHYVKIFALLLVSLSIVGYLGLQIRTIISPPALVVYSPSDGIQTQEALIRVTGLAQEEAIVRVNGSNVLQSKDGMFEVEVALERGLNVITIESSKRYSKTTTQYRRVVLGADRSISFVP